MSHYRLQPLLTLRAQAKESAEQAFAEASKRLAGARVKLHELETDLARRRDERKRRLRSFADAVMNDGGHADGFHQVNRFADRLKDEESPIEREVELQREAVRRAERDLELKREGMAQSAKELEAIASHEQSWAARRRAAREAREEQALEEVASALRLMRART
jgi:flagellar biosynthesis chaperone FliJ